MAKRYELTDEQWRRIADFLPGKASDPGRTGNDNRLFVNAVLWVLRSGARWSDLPERYGKWKTEHKRFTRWAKAGVWERVFDSLTGDPDNQYLMLEHLGARPPTGCDRKRGDRNQALGRSRGGLTTKIHVVADAQGRPLRFLLTGGEAHDILAAPQLLSGLAAGGVIADKAYDSNTLPTSSPRPAPKPSFHPEPGARSPSRITPWSTGSVIASSGSSTNSSIFGISPHATIAAPSTSSLAFISPAL
jgi:transposase